MVMVVLLNYIWYNPFVSEYFQWDARYIHPVLVDESRPGVLDENGHQIQRFAGDKIDSD